MKWCLRTCKHSSCLLLVMSLVKLADTKSGAQECRLGEAATPVAALSSSQWHSSINGAVERNLSGKRSFSRSVFTRFFFWWVFGVVRFDSEVPPDFAAHDDHRVEWRTVSLWTCSDLFTHACVHTRTAWSDPLVPLQLGAAEAEAEVLSLKCFSGCQADFNMPPPLRFSPAAFILLSFGESFNFFWEGGWGGYFVLFIHLVVVLF